MDNNRLVKEIFSKRPFIMKSLLKMTDINEVNDKIILHIRDLIEHKKTKRILLAYNNYKSVFQFYDSLLEITKEKAIDLSFLSLDFDEKIKILNNYNIEYEVTTKKNIIIYPKNFTETSKVGSPEWCIVRQENYWNDYNLENKFAIVATKTDLIGFTYNDRKIEIFDKDNQKIPTYLLLSRTNYDNRIGFIVRDISNFKSSIKEKMNFIKDGIKQLSVFMGIALFSSYLIGLDFMEVMILFLALSFTINISLLISSGCLVMSIFDRGILNDYPIRRLINKTKSSLFLLFLIISFVEGTNIKDFIMEIQKESVYKVNLYGYEKYLAVSEDSFLNSSIESDIEVFKIKVENLKSFLQD